jgi:toxin-antitoxin system PIN domain toxin
VLLDANILLDGFNAATPRHAAARTLLSDIFSGTTRVALPWQTIGAFVRISSNPRAFAQPLTGAEAWGYVQQWLARSVTWIPPATELTAAVYGRLASQVNITANLVPDAMLAALAIEHGQELWTADSDFARFPALSWRDPLATS